MSDKNKQLYFVALVPPDKIYDRVWKLKEEVQEKFDSKAALRSPPHITLHMPFTFREDREPVIFETMEGAVNDQKSVVITHSGFGSFPPRVIYVNVTETEELDQFRKQVVRAMRLGLKLENADYKDKPFHPHMTIAFRDLKKRVFPEAWKYYQDQEFEEEWKCDALVLLKHNGKHWEEYRSFGFGV